MEFVNGLLRVLVIMAIGAIVYDIWKNPEGTKAAVGGVNSILTTGYAAELGRTPKGYK